MKRKLSNPIIPVAVAAVGVLFMTGCGNTATTSQPVNPMNQSVAPLPDASVIAPVSEMAYVNVWVEGAVVGDTSPTVLTRVTEKIESELLRTGYAINIGEPDVRVGFDIETTLFDQSGNYYLYEATADVVILLPSSAEMLAQNVFSTKGERSLGEQKALLSLSKKIGSEIGIWVESKTAPIKLGIVATNITIRRPRFTDLSDYAVKFTNTVNDVDGVLRCTLVNRDDANRQLTFRVSYFAKQFPQGLLNHLGTIEELNLDLD